MGFHCGVSGWGIGVSTQMGVVIVWWRGGDDGGEVQGGDSRTGGCGRVKEGGGDELVAQRGT